MLKSQKLKKDEMNKAKLKEFSLHVNTAGLSLMSNVKACGDGMSPLMERFVANKLRKNQIID